MTDTVSKINALRHKWRDDVLLPEESLDNYRSYWGGYDSALDDVEDILESARVDGPPGIAPTS